MSIENCLNKKHDLVEIYVDGYEDHPCTVVRWCKECGAVVVDTDYDGRTKPGDIMKMRTPRTFQKVWKYRKENPM
jgi:hypothetical protein